MGQELETAGVNCQDPEVVVGGKLISLRQPADIPTFMLGIFRVIGLV